MFIQHISDLQECWGDINEILRDKKPLYVLIDEAHMMPANDPVWMHLKKPHSPVITIAAAECVATMKKVLIFSPTDTAFLVSKWPISLSLQSVND